MNKELKQPKTKSEKQYYNKCLDDASKFYNEKFILIKQNGDTIIKWADGSGRSTNLTKQFNASKCAVVNYRKAHKAMNDFMVKYNPCGNCSGSSVWENKTLRCCEQCEERHGYLENYDNRTLLDYRTFKKGGFHNGSGCSLPRELRSFTCVSYLCNDATKRLSPNIRKEYNCLWHLLFDRHEKLAYYTYIHKTTKPEPKTLKER